MTPTSNRPGRPRVDAAAPSVSVHLKLSATLYDTAYQAAHASRQTVNDWIRDQIRGGLTRRPPLEAPGARR